MRLTFMAAVLLPLALTACSDPPDRTVASPNTSTSASPSTSTSASPTPGATPALPGIASSAAVPLPSRDLSVHLIGEGLDLPTRVLVFGDPLERARPDLLRFLGRPTAEQSTELVAGCDSEDVRLLDYSGGGLQLQFGTPAGGREQVLLSWLLRSDDPGAPRARALVGDVTTFEFGPGTTVAQLREGLGERLTLQAGDELMAPGFRVEDQSGGLRGELSGTTSTDRVQSVRAGQGCE